MSKVSDKLQEARALIEKGWCKVNYWKLNSEHEVTHCCALGALYRVTDPECISAFPAFAIDITHLRRALMRVLSPEFKNSIVCFNDDAKDKQEVLDLYDRAIEAEESR